MTISPTGFSPLSSSHAASAAQSAEQEAWVNSVFSGKEELSSEPLPVDHEAVLGGPSSNLMPVVHEAKLSDAPQTPPALPFCQRLLPPKYAKLCVNANSDERRHVNPHRVALTPTPIGTNLTSVFEQILCAMREGQALEDLADEIHNAHPTLAAPLTPPSSEGLSSKISPPKKDPLETAGAAVQKKGMPAQMACLIFSTREITAESLNEHLKHRGIAPKRKIGETLALAGEACDSLRSKKKRTNVIDLTD